MIIRYFTLHYDYNYYYLQDQDVRQRHHPGEQNRKDERYGVDPTDGFDEEQCTIYM